MGNDNFLLIKFDNEKDALSALEELDSQHSLKHHEGVACSVVLKKDADAKVVALDKYSAKKIDIINDIKEAEINSEVALGAYVYTDLGSLTFLILTISRAIKNFISEVEGVVIEKEFIHAAKQHLESNKVVIVAHAIEDDFTIIDKLMANYNGEITRTPVK